MLGELKKVNLEVFLTCTLKSLSTKLKKKYNPNILRTEKSFSMLCLIEQYGPSSENDKSVLIAQSYSLFETGH